MESVAKGIVAKDLPGSGKEVAGKLVRARGQRIAQKCHQSFIDGQRASGKQIWIDLVGKERSEDWQEGK